MIKIMLISSLFWGLLSSILAGRQKRNAYLWFLIGSLFGAFGMGFLFFFRKPKKQPTPPKSTTAAEPQPLIYWYYLADSKQYGPMTLNALKKSFHEEKITEETYLWNEDMTEWRKLSTLPILDQLTS